MYICTKKKLLHLVISFLVIVVIINVSLTLFLPLNWTLGKNNARGKGHGASDLKKVNSVVLNPDVKHGRALTKSIPSTVNAILCNSNSSADCSAKSVGSGSTESQNVLEAFSGCGEWVTNIITTIDKPFQKLDDSDHVYVVSAFYDSGMIRILGVSDTVQLETLYCRLWYENKANQSSGLKNYQTKTVAGRMEKFHKPKVRYKEVFFFCPTNETSIPVAVSLVTHKCKPALNSLEIRNRIEEQYKYNFTVCLKPFYLNYSKAFALVEWIEFNLLLGAQYFTFYNYTLYHELNPIMEWYSKRGLAEVIQWPLPMRAHVNREIEWAGQLIALNDCHYRKRYNSKFTVQIDADEFLIPRNKKKMTWSEVLENLPDADIYMFQNTFFKLEWPDSDIAFEGKDTAREYGLNTLLKFQREQKIFRPYDRSKYIARTDTVTIVHNHDAVTKRGKKYVIPITEGLVQHYRDWENPEDPKERVIDTTMLKYKDKLLRNVKEAWSNIKAIEGKRP